MYTTTERVLIAWKWLLSFTKRKWRIADYPVRVRVNGQSPERSIAFCAQILNWPGPAGLGPTKEEAYAQLARNLEEIRKQRDRMPRPGTRVPIQFASTTRVESDPALLDDFVERVLLFTQRTPVFISDASSLSDFGDEAKVADLLDRIQSTYGVDATDIPDGNIAAILEKIRERKGKVDITDC